MFFESVGVLLKSERGESLGLGRILAYWCFHLLFHEGDFCLDSDAQDAEVLRH